MAMSNSPDVGAALGKALTEAPIGAMILSIAKGIADAQHALDMAMVRTAIMMTGEIEEPDGTKKSSLIKFEGEEVSLLELGFTPTFYQFSETSIEVKISLSMSASDESQTDNYDLAMNAGTSVGPKSFLSPGFGLSMSANVSSVSATYSSKYSYSAEGSSSVRTRIVPVPPPALLEERLRRSLDKKFAKRK